MLNGTVEGTVRDANTGEVLIGATVRIGGTALGAATMAQGEDVVQLRDNVTSKKGTTEQAILSFQADQLAHTVNNATAAAHRRALELANELTAD